MTCVPLPNPFRTISPDCCGICGFERAKAPAVLHTARHHGTQTRSPVFQEGPGIRKGMDTVMGPWIQYAENWHDNATPEDFHHSAYPQPFCDLLCWQSSGALALMA